jgi:molybdate transport system regulatory protein
MDRFMTFLKKNVRVRSKIWLEADGLPLMGSGRAELLRAVEQTGSINAAAKALGMDYRRAWGLIDSMEKRLTVKLVVRTRGGAGRGTALTENCRTLLSLYDRMAQGSQEAADGHFSQIFRKPSRC